MRSVNVYDFDHTIYSGDASFDFIAYCLLRNAKFWKHLPSIGWVLWLYILGFAERRQVKEVAFKFLADIQDIDGMIEKFWEKYSKNVKPFFLDMYGKGDLIISASPEFLLRPLTERLKIELIATVMDKKTGRIMGENCRAKEKLARLKAVYPELVIDNMYSDSWSDLPLMEVARQGYIVKGSKLIPYKNYKQSAITRLKNPKFIRFIVVGCINATIGVTLSYILSLYMDAPQLAFVVGFFISLIPSYFLNSIITFRNHRFSIGNFWSYVISYMPNFVIMIVFVHVFTVLFAIPPLITYVLAVAIAVPITFILLSMYTFKSERSDDEDA